MNAFELDLLPADDDTPEMLHRKLLLANALLERDALRICALQSAVKALGGHLVLLCDLRRRGANEAALSHLDAFDLSRPVPPVVH